MSRNNPEILGNRKAENRWYAPFKVAGLYTLVAGLWIALSDQVLLWFFVSGEQLTRYQTVKWWFFVVATAAMLVWLVRRNLAELQTEVDLCRLTQERFRALVETIPHGIQECDTKGILTFTNASYDRIFGYAPGEALGTTIWDREETEESRQGLQDYLAFLVTKQPEPTPFFTRNVTTDGQIIDVQVDWAYLREETGRLLGFASVLTDITEQIKAEEAIQTSDRMKSELISTAAHEFRTPLTTIQGFSELLLLGGHDISPAEQKEYLSIVFKKSLDLAEMLGNLLDLSRVEAGLPIPMQLAPCTVAEVVNGVAPFVKILIGQQRVEIALADEQTLVRVDRGKIEQVLENLLSNGAKYSSPDSVIRLCGAQIGEAYRVEVVDQGVGMNEEQLTHVFERFYRGDHSDSSPSGFGIGMSIVKQIVEAHGGVVRIESVPGEGTTVSFDLPIAVQPAQPAE